MALNDESNKGDSGFLIGILILIGVFYSSYYLTIKYQASKNESGNHWVIKKEFTEEWTDNFSIHISKTLTVNHIRNCGEFEYKIGLQHSNYYLVRCTRDGVTWIYYYVWTQPDNKVFGPVY